MQIDMHYYGTYAMARAAGLKKKAATIVATAAQFVDDNAEKESIEFKDSGRLDAQATAHHSLNIKNIDEEDQRQIWVPFHFLPGNKGDSFTERLICRMNSPIVKGMIDYNLSHLNMPYALHLAGVTAHVYADTFSHYGFSGISSRRNRVKNDSFEFSRDLNPETRDYINGKAESFKKKYPREGGGLVNIKSWIAEKFSGALGHGAVVTFPDRPYLVWRFTYEKPKADSKWRKNPVTFLKGAHALHELFRRTAKERPDFADGKFKKFSSIESTVKDILSLQAKKEDRIQEWQRAAQDGILFATGKEKIPVYKADDWLEQRKSLDGRKDSKLALASNVFRFYQAASVHRNHVLRTLLPKYGLVVA
jgi:hypothetical protein